MERIGTSDARRHLHRLLDHVARGESLTITRRGKPVARLVPLTHDRNRAQQSAARILDRRKHPKHFLLAAFIGRFTRVTTIEQSLVPTRNSARLHPTREAGDQVSLTPRL